MRLDGPITRTYTHVWSLTDDDGFMSNSPTWGWVAIGPRGHNAGAEATAEQAKRCAQCAAFLLQPQKSV